MKENKTIHVVLAENHECVGFETAICACEDEATAKSFSDAYRYGSSVKEVRVFDSEFEVEAIESFTVKIRLHNGEAIGLFEQWPRANARLVCSFEPDFIHATSPPTIECIGEAPDSSYKVITIFGKSEDEVKLAATGIVASIKSGVMAPVETGRIFDNELYEIEH